MNRGALAALAAGVGFVLTGTATAQNSSQGQAQGQAQAPAATTQAPPEKETWKAPFGGSWTATFAFATDYSYRGISQTQRQVAVQPSFTYETPTPRDLAPYRGIPFDPMRTSYFVGRNSYVGATKPLLPRWQQQLFLVLARFAVSAADFFGLPANRTVELGSRIEI